MMQASAFQVLFIGGTNFIGKMMIDNLLLNGAQITVFSRRQPLQASVTFIEGDRNNQESLRRLKEEITGQQFDVVYDMCAYTPDQSASMLPVLEGHYKQLVFFSSAAVYERTQFFPCTENSPLGENPTFGPYGVNKAAIEKMYVKAVKQSKNSQLTIFRPHYILGPGDYFQRHHYILSRVEKNMPVFLPGDGQAVIQFAYSCDVVDLFLRTPRLQTTKVEILNVASSEMMTLQGVVEKIAAPLKQVPKIIFQEYTSIGKDDKLFYDELFPFPNLNFIIDNTKSIEKYSYQDSFVSTYVEELHEDWQKTKKEYKQVLSELEN